MAAYIYTTSLRDTVLKHRVTPLRSHYRQRYGTAVLRYECGGRYGTAVLRYGSGGGPTGAPPTAAAMSYICITLLHLYQLLLYLMTTIVTVPDQVKHRFTWYDTTVCVVKKPVK